MRWLDDITDSIDMNSGVGEEQGSLTCCSPWGHKESDTTGRLKNNDSITLIFILKDSSSCMTGNGLEARVQLDAQES